MQPDGSTTIVVTVIPGLLLAWYLWAGRAALLWGALGFALATTLHGPIYSIICGTIQKPWDWSGFVIDLSIAAAAAILLIRHRRRR
ncbi:MAG TPA: hypothetical protein VM659_24395 [Dongiaceae bacterium]|nr:hypothetical protein [Dongiaceae bacterium]